MNTSPTFTLQQLCLITDSLHSKLQWTKMLWMCTNNTWMGVKFTSLPNEIMIQNYVHLMYLQRQTNGGEDVGFRALTPYCVVHNHLHLLGWSNGVVVETTWMRWQVVWLHWLSARNVANQNYGKVEGDRSVLDKRTWNSEKSGYRTILSSTTRMGNVYKFFPMAQQPLVDRDLLIIKALWSHSDTPHTVGFLSMSELPYRVLYLTTHNTHKRQDIHAPGRVRTHIPSEWVATDVGLRLCMHWDWCE